MGSAFNEANEANNIVVSVIMLCYNHEPYIRQAIEGVLMQKTKFDFELLIHDDASTDKSAEIIQEYQTKYPSKIQAVLQTENQYSQHIPIRKTFLEPLIRGKYIALCECDDYWLDCNKLQTQIDILENNPQLIGCTHNCRLVDAEDRVFADQYGVYKRCKEHVYSLKDAAVGAYFPGQTAALVYRRAGLAFHSEEEEHDYLKIRTRSGDLRRNFKLLLSGDIYYLPFEMSAHRVVKDKGDSWTARMRGKNLTFERFASSIDMRRFARKYYSRTYCNYYTTLRAGINGVWKRLKSPTDENKSNLEKMYREKGNAFYFALYLFCLLIRSVPLMFQRHVMARRRFM